MSEFATRLAEDAALIEQTLDALLPPEGAGAQGRLACAMRHAAMGGGKRLRGFLCLQGAALFGADRARAARVAAAAEMLHAYSLIHDDLPCMDDDDLRRGRPTVHVAFDEATAVLAGDALQTLAFEVLAAPETHADPGIRAALVLALAQASGWDGMVGGQALDIAAENADAPLIADEVARLQALKTGALIRFSAESGAILAGADAAQRARMVAYGEALGAAFQIQDDVLDVEGDAAAAGKRLGKDQAAGKATFVATMGLEAAKARAQELVEQATDALAHHGGGARALAEAARFAVTRSA